jgi:hypothetical protein
MARQEAQHASRKHRTSNASTRGGKSQKDQTPTAGISNRPPEEEHNRQEKIPPRGRAKE